MSPYIQLSRNQWLYLTAVVLIVLPLVLLLTTTTTVGNWYALEVWAPDLERDLGFHADVAKHPAFGEPVFQVVTVTAGGAFDRAGVKPGDVPDRLEHGPGDFYGWLEHNRGRQVSVAFSRFAPNQLREMFGKRVNATVAVPQRPN